MRLGVAVTNMMQIRDSITLRIVLKVPHGEVKSGLYKLIVKAIALIMKDSVTILRGAPQCRFLSR